MIRGSRGREDGSMTTDVYAFAASDAPDVKQTYSVTRDRYLDGRLRSRDEGDTPAVPGEPTGF